MRLLPGAGWRGKWDTGSRRVEIFRCKISKFWGSEVLHAAGSVSISLKFAQREIIQCTHRWKCNLLDYINCSVYESITWSLCTQCIYTIFVSYTLVRLGKKKRVGGRWFSLLNGAQSRLHISLMTHFAYTCAGVQRQQPGNHPEEISGVGREWCSLWLKVRDCMFILSFRFCFILWEKH